MKKYFAASVSMLVAAPVYAGGFTAPTVEVQPVAVVEVAPANWAGGYVGANINYGTGKLKAAGALAEELSAEGLSRTLVKPDGASGALRAGYDWQSGRTVYGLGAEYNFAAYKETVGDSELSADLKFKNTATIYARAGYLVNDSFLAYGLVGYSRAKLEASVQGLSDSVNLSGATLGLGGEYKINQNWSTYGEYAYTNFGKVKDSEGQIKASLGQIKLGVSYRF